MKRRHHRNAKLYVSRPALQVVVINTHTQHRPLRRRLPNVRPSKRRDASLRTSAAWSTDDGTRTASNPLRNLEYVLILTSELPTFKDFLVRAEIMREFLHMDHLMIGSIEFHKFLMAPGFDYSTVVEDKYSVRIANSR